MQRVQGRRCVRDRTTPPIPRVPSWYPDAPPPTSTLDCLSLACCTRRRRGGSITHTTSYASVRSCSPKLSVLFMSVYMHPSFPRRVPSAHTFSPRLDPPHSHPPTRCPCGLLAAPSEARPHTEARAITHPIPPAPLRQRRRRRFLPRTRFFRPVALHASAPAGARGPRETGGAVQRKCGDGDVGSRLFFASSSCHFFGRHTPTT